jgi:hypothetical protein
LSKYYVGVTRLILRDPSFKDILGECGLTVLDTIDTRPPEWDLVSGLEDPLEHLTNSVYLVVEDPAAGPEFEGKHVALAFQVEASTTDTGDDPEHMQFTFHISDRRIA